MRRPLFTLFISVQVILTSAQCPTGNVLISSSADLSNYVMLYGSCDTLPGDLIISEPQSSIDHSAFSNLQMISGDLHLQAIPPGAPDLTGFDQLTYIGGDLFLNSLPAISLNGLGALEKIDGDLLIQFVGITDFTGLSSLSVIGGDLEVIFAASMTSINGLVQLDSIHGDFMITYVIDHPGFTTITLPNDLEFVGGSLHVQSDHATSITGGNSLDRIGWNLYVSGPMLQTVTGMNNLNVIGGSLDLNFLPAFTTINAFNGLDTIHGSLRVINTPLLASLAGFPELEAIDSSMWITGNSLLSITGFPQLSSIGTLSLPGSPILDDISAFDHQIALGDLFILNNPALSVCHVQAVCDKLEILGPNFQNVGNNASGCTTAQEVLSQCDFTTGLDLPEENANTLTLYPNPVLEVLHIISDIPVDRIQIYDISGKAIRMEALNLRSINVSGLPAGAYLVRLYYSDGQRTLIFMKD